MIVQVMDILVFWIDLRMCVITNTFPSAQHLIRSLGVFHCDIMLSNKSMVSD